MAVGGQALSLKQNEKNRHRADIPNRRGRRTMAVMFNSFLKGTPP